MKLTKSEAHFRTRIIQESHLKKWQQQMVDYYAKDKKRSYRDMYYTLRLRTWLDSIEFSVPNTQSALDELSNAIAGTAVSANDVIKTFEESLKNCCNYFNNVFDEAKKQERLREYQEEELCGGSE